MENPRTFKDMKERASSFDCAVEACMDGYVRVGPKTLKLGEAGSGVVNKDPDTESEIYPIEDRKKVEMISGSVRKGLVNMAKSLGIPLYSCSHPGCGAGNAQHFSTDELIKATKALADKDVLYMGHISVSETPQVVGSSPVAASINREESDHSHEEERTRLTIGGAIKGNEQTEEGLAFDLTVDWPGFVPLEERQKDQVLIDGILAQMKLSWMIARRMRENTKDPFVIYNAGRVKDKKVLNENRRIAMKAIRQANEAISGGQWQVSAHH